MHIEIHDAAVEARLRRQIQATRRGIEQLDSGEASADVADRVEFGIRDRIVFLAKTPGGDPSCLSGGGAHSRGAPVMEKDRKIPAPLAFGERSPRPWPLCAG